MLTKIRFTNFKGLKSTTLRLGRLTVLIGPNASGKTSILQGIRIATDLMRLPVEKFGTVFSGALHESNIFTRGGAGRIEFVAKFENPNFIFEAFGENPAGQIAADSRDINEIPHWNWSTNRPENPSGVEPIATFLRLDSAKLAAPHSAVFGRRIEEDGTGLVSTLIPIRLNDDVKFNAIVEHVRAIVPTLERVGFRDRTVYLQEVLNGGVINAKTAAENTQQHAIMFRAYPAQELTFDFVDAKNVPASMASEGTVLALGLVTIFYAENRPSLVLLDDLDRALHPRAQKALMEVIRKALELFPELQVVATTHSPYLLDCLEYDEVRVVHRDDTGNVHVGRFAQHPEFDRWKEEFAPGEFWSLVGEDWLTKAVKP